MKKVLLSGFVFVLAACSANYDDCGCCQEELVPDMYQTETFMLPTTVVQTCNSTVFDSCKCANAPTITREVLRPRIKVVVEEKTKRNCPNDTQKINCVCGECEVSTQQVVDKTVAETVPSMPEAYELAASRVFNNFIKDTVKVYSEKPNVLLYLMPTDLLNEDLPGGAQQGVTTIKNQVLSSFTYALTDDENNNDYVLKTSAEWFDTPSKTVPAIKYEATLFDKENNVIGQWVEIVKKAENSEKWL